SGSPSVTLANSSWARACARSVASLTAATIRSSTTSRSSGLKSDGSIESRRSSPLAEATAFTRPAPASPSTSIVSSCSCTSAILVCISCAWRMSLPMSPRLPNPFSIALQLLCKGIVGIPAVVQIIPRNLLRTGRGVDFFRIGMRAHGADFRPGKGRHHRLYQRMGERLGLAAPLLGGAALGHRLRAPGTHHRHAPARAGPLPEPPGEPRREIGGGVLRRFELDPSRGEMHEPDTRLDLGQERDVAFLA